MNISNVTKGLALSALLSFPAYAQEDLGARVEQLEQQIKILKRQIELDREAATEKSKTAPVLSAGASGFSFRSADTNFVLKVRGYAHVDGRFFPNDSNVTAANDSFLIRRLRPILEGTVYDRFDYRIMLDFPSNASISAANNGLVQDAYLNTRIQPWFQIQAGKFKEPVSLERLQSASNMLFVERGYPSQLAPNRDVGVQLHGEVLDARLKYQLGVFNGVADGGSTDFESGDDEKDVAARIFIEPFLKSDKDALRGLGFGIAGTYGNREGALRGFSSPGQQSFFTYNPANVGASTVTAVADGRQWRLAPQAYYYYGPFGIFGEYIISDQTLKRTVGTGAAASSTWNSFQNSGWVVAGSYFLTGEDNSYKAVQPKQAFSFGDNGYGAVELTARVQQLDVDDDVFTLRYANPATSGSKATSWGVGVNWHLNRNVKLSLNYEQTDFDGGTSALLTDGEKVVLTRAQFSF